MIEGKKAEKWEKRNTGKIQWERKEKIKAKQIWLIQKLLKLLKRQQYKEIKKR